MADIQHGRRTRLRLLINTLKIKDKQFANSVQKSPSFVSQMLNGHRSITADFIFHIAKYYPINPSWMLDGQGDMILSSETPLSVMKEPTAVYEPPGLLEKLIAETDWLKQVIAAMEERIERLEECNQP